MSKLNRITFTVLLCSSGCLGESELGGGSSEGEMFLESESGDATGVGPDEKDEEEGEGDHGERETTSTETHEESPDEESRGESSEEDGSGEESETGSTTGTESTESETSEGEYGEESESEGDGDPDEGDASEEDTGGEPEPPADDPLKARGNLSIRRMSLNQGVEINLYSKGEYIPAKDRLGPVIKKRPGLFRAYWSIPAGWKRRVIEARLYIDNGSERKTYTTKADVFGNSSPEALDRTFSWKIAAKFITPQSKYRIELWETDAKHNSIEASDEAPNFPQRGWQSLGVSPHRMELKVKIVPVVYQTDDCKTDTSKLSNEQKDRFRSLLRQRNPVSSLNLTWRSKPIVRKTPFTKFWQLLDILREVRERDKAPPNQYYFALIDFCGENAVGVDGSGPITKPTKADAVDRVSAGVWKSKTEGRGPDVFVHEIGHQQGRKHLPKKNTEGCYGPKPGKDSEYPYDNATIQQWGWAIEDHVLYDPSKYKDYMAICRPIWVGDYTWRKTAERIRILSSWDD